MYGEQYRDRPERLETLQEREELFDDEIKTLLNPQSPLASDGVFTAQIAGLKEAKARYYPSREWIQEYLNRRRDIRATDFPHYIQKATQTQYLDTPGYPTDQVYQAAGMWQDVFQQLSHPGTLEYDVFHSFMLREDLKISTNVTNRALTTIILNKVASNRFGDGLSVVEGGSSLGLRNKKLARSSASKGRFPRVTVLQRPNNHQSADEILVEDRQATEEINAAAYAGIQLRYGLSMDLMDPYDILIQRWVKSQFTPFELNPSHPEYNRVKEFDALVNSQLSNVHFLRADITDVTRADLADLPPMHAGGFDIGDLTFVLYQLSEVARQQAINNMLGLLNENGLLVVTDFVRTDPQDPSRLVFDIHHYISKWQVRTYVRSPVDKSGAFHELLSAETGRFQAIRLGTAIGRDASTGALKLLLPT